MSIEFKTVPQFAKALGVNNDKVHSWIRSGELRAINVAESLKTRPRFRIAQADVEAFLNRRAAASVRDPQPITRARRAPVGDVPRRF